jgi:hypothetical protein
LHPPPRPARQLPRSRRRLPDDRRDVLERYGEHVVQHERQPLGRRQRLQYDEQRKADRIRLHRFELRIGYVDIGERGGVVADGLLGMATPQPQHVQADPPDHGRQPAAEVLDGVGVGATEPDPGLLDGILGFGGGA